MNYLFVLSTDGGWWLKIDTVEQLIDYHQKTDGHKYENAISNFLNGLWPEDLLNKAKNSKNLEDLLALYTNRDFQYMQAALLKAESTGGTILDGFSMLRVESGLSELKVLHKYGSVYINPVGGHTFHIKYTQFYRKTELIFPNFTEKDVHIKQYGENGIHWYAYIGDMQLFCGEKRKWNTYKAAKEYAYSVLNLC